MKRILALLLVAAMLPIAAMTAFADADAAAADSLAALTTMEENGSILVPIRKFAEGIGAKVEWNFLTEVATLTFGEHVVELKEGKETATVGGEEVAITVPVRKYNGILYGPVRFIAENLGFPVSWDPETERVEIGEGQEKLAEPADIGNLYEVVGVSASEDDGNKPENVLDRNYQTRWSASSKGAYITLELEEVKPVAYVGVAAYNGEERQTTLSVQVSTDGTNFKEVVTNWISSITLDMEPIDLGGVYDAKYVRILGYGNTMNEWNSLTELSVYGPYDGEGMPVATDGPGAVASGGELTEEQAAALKKFDKLFDRLDVWYANLYHHEDGGFFMTMSGKDDPALECGLEMTFYAMSGIQTYSNIYAEMPDAVKQRFIDYIIERQDPATGMFIDHQGPVNDRETARNQNCVMGWVNRWKIELPYVHPSQAAQAGESTSSTNTAVMPEYMASVDSYIKWVEHWDWEHGSWTAGDQTQQSLSYLNLLPKEQYEVYKKALMEWLENRQFEDTGYWSPYLDFNAVSGAFKVGLVYSGLKEKVPMADKVIDTTISVMENVYPDVAHYVRNPLSLLQQLAAYDPAYSEQIKDAITRNMDTFIAWFDQFLAPDGGFAQYHGKSMSNFGGLYSSHQLWEGDVDSTLMILIARKSIYNLMGLSAPLLEFDPDFWEWISGAKPTPSPYIDEKYQNVSAEGNVKEGKQDFEGFEAGTKLTGEEFGSTAYQGNSARIVMDRDRKDNRVLELTYDGSQSGGPKFTVGGMADEMSAVRFVPIEEQRTVVEFDLKFNNLTGSNNFYIGLGSTIAYALNFQGKGAQGVGNRIDGNQVAYGGNFTTLKPNEWYRIRVECTSNDKTKFLAKIYVDGELVSTNQSYLNMETAEPGNPYGAVTLTWYRAGAGTVYLDNIYMKQIS